MKVNRVFWFSKEVALQNGNRLPMSQGKFAAIIMGSILPIFLIIGPLINVDNLENSGASEIYLILSFVIVAFIIFFMGFYKRNGDITAMSAWAVTDDNRIFKFQEYDHSTEGSEDGYYIKKDIVKADGTLTQKEIYIEKALAWVNNPEIVVRHIMAVLNNPRVGTNRDIEILKVHSILDNGKSVNVNCDYRILKNNKIKYAKNIRVAKAYNRFDDLINLINSHR